LYDSGYDDQNRFVIWSSEYKKKFIQKADVAIIDGRFERILGFLLNDDSSYFYIRKNISTFYVLLANKKELSYIRAIYYISNICKLVPKTVVIDFEQALYNSLKVVYANICIYFATFILHNRFIEI
jgi:hypothetical protein